MADLFKPAPPHNPMKAPAVCLCVDCCHVMVGKRCTATDGVHQCGDYAGHRKEHTMLVATVFQVSEERIHAATPTGETKQ